MQILDSEQTTRHLPFERLIPALRDMFVQGCQVPLRHTHAIDGGPGASGTLLIMPAWQAGGRLGVKTVCIFPGNQARGLPGLHSTYVLSDAASGKPLAMLDGDAITSRRTAAASALAASWLARADARKLLVLGAGRVGALLPYAYRAVRDIAQVEVWNPNAQRAQALVERLRADGFEAQVSQDLQASVRQADIVSCATLANAPLVRGEWLQPGAHLDLIGSFAPAMRESDAQCFARATVFVDTPEALAKSGDILEAVREGAFDPAATAATLEQLCRREHAGRKDQAQITLFKSVGTALEDLAAASLAYDAAQGAQVRQA
ncbi:ornithine cyclodeaminase family protein [Orrella sp. JC864]|uniref:ornithine cyclodeaminase family protein n=1 Tax=Orrella sp. JC864 TaxID=3120298 RepID=UPI003009705A